MFRGFDKHDKVLDYQYKLFNFVEQANELIREYYCHINSKDFNACVVEFQEVSDLKQLILNNKKVDEYEELYNIWKEKIVILQNRNKNKKTLEASEKKSEPGISHLEQERDNRKIIEASLERELKRDQRRKQKIKNIPTIQYEKGEAKITNQCAKRSIQKDFNDPRWAGFNKLFAQPLDLYKLAREAFQKTDHDSRFENFEEADRYCRAYIEKEPKDPQGYYLLASIHEKYLQHFQYDAFENYLLIRDNFQKYFIFAPNTPEEAVRIFYATNKISEFNKKIENAKTNSPNPPQTPKR